MYLHPRDNRYRVTLATSGGNRSWDGVKKSISAKECDLVFIVCSDKTTYEIPATVLDGRANLALGEKYDTYKLG